MGQIQIKRRQQAPAPPVTDADVQAPSSLNTGTRCTM